MSGRLRKPFDPNDLPLREGDAVAEPRSARPMTVSELTRLVKSAIEKELPSTLLVAGEISNLSQPAGGHLYFSLKDASSEVRCVMWRSAAATLKFRPADGMAVTARGAVEVYEPRGQYQLYVRSLEPTGVGALDLAFRQLRDRLRAEGLFDAARKRSLPRFPVQIAVVTSPSGAAIQDILQTLRRRFPAVRVLLYPVRVQGQGAAEEIAEAIRRINESREALGGVDVMIVGRGGGSLEDLWAFNEEVVARAIHASVIPVVSAVGHEVDFTIADFVADVRAATPTAAAETVVPQATEVLAQLEVTGRRMIRGIVGQRDRAAGRLALVEKSEWFRDPLSRLGRFQQRVDEFMGRLRWSGARTLETRRTALHALEVRLSRLKPTEFFARRREALARMETGLARSIGRRMLAAEQRLARMVSRLEAASPRPAVQRALEATRQIEARFGRGLRTGLADRARTLRDLEVRLEAGSPRRVLARGFTITRHELNGRIVLKPQDVREGERVVTQTAAGDFTSRVVDPEQGELF